MRKKKHPDRLRNRGAKKHGGIIPPCFFLYPEKNCSIHTVDERDDLTAGADIVRSEQIGAGITGSDAVINCPENRFGIELAVFHIRERVFSRPIREPVYDLIETVQEGNDLRSGAGIVRPEFVRAGVSGGDAVGGCPGHSLIVIVRFLDIRKGRDVCCFGIRPSDSAPKEGLRMKV